MTLARGIAVFLFAVSVVGAAAPDQPAQEVQQLSRTVELLVKDYRHMFDRLEQRIFYLENKVADLEQENQALRVEIAAARDLWREEPGEEREVAYSLGEETVSASVDFAGEWASDLQSFLDSALTRQLRVMEERWLPLVKIMGQFVVAGSGARPEADDLAARAHDESIPRPAVAQGDETSGALEQSAYAGSADSGAEMPTTNPATDSFMAERGSDMELARPAEPPDARADNTDTDAPAVPSLGLLEPLPENLESESSEKPPVPRESLTRKLIDALKNLQSVMPPDPARDLEPSDPLERSDAPIPWEEKPSPPAESLEVLQALNAL
jgi:hypothetical protein